MSSAIFCLLLHCGAELCRDLQKIVVLPISQVDRDEGLRMANNKELEAGLRKIAENFHLPGGGQMKLSRLVAEHLDWFDAAERRGMGWRDMIRALTAAGVTGKGGKPLSVGTLSATVWRKRADVELATNRTGRNVGIGSSAPAPQHLRRPNKAKRPSAGQPQRSKRASSRPTDDPAQAGRHGPTTSMGRANEIRAQSKDVLAFMDRARTVRRRSE